MHKLIPKGVKQRIKKIIYEKELSLKKEGYLFSANETNENDIFIVGYPKSGNTWFQNITSSLLFGTSPEYTPDALVQELVPGMSKKYFKRYLEFGIFKTHDKPSPKYKKVVYLVRDGRDVMVSFHHYNNNVVNRKVSLKEMIVDGKGLTPENCKWHEHVNLWLDNPFNAKMIIIKYEDMLENPLENLKRFSNFLGIERSDEILLNIADKCSYEKMKSKYAKFGWKHPRIKSNNFFRSGKKGDYKEILPKDLEKYFMNESKETLKKLGYL